MVRQLSRLQIDPSTIRVPLDVQRAAVRSLRWRPLSLTEQNVSSTEDLLKLLDAVRGLQQRTGHQLPMLVDENIHYRVLRMLYAADFSPWDMHRYLCDVPLLYGVWHAYKHTMTVVYRTFLPVLGHLEVDGRVSGVQRSYRRVLFMEKMFAALLLCKDRVLDLVNAQLRTTRDTEGPVSSGASLIQGLHELLTFYVPALFNLGYQVRQCTWEGRPDGRVKGDTARGILEHCVVLQTHLQEDWVGRTHYVRTMSLALLTWQPHICSCTV